MANVGLFLFLRSLFLLVCLIGFELLFSCIGSFTIGFFAFWANEVSVGPHAWLITPEFVLFHCNGDGHGKGQDNPLLQSGFMSDRSRILISFL